MKPLECREAEAVISSRAFVVSNSQAGAIQQADKERLHFLLGKPRPVKIAGNCAADPREDLSERNQTSSAQIHTDSHAGEMTRRGFIAHGAIPDGPAARIAIVETATATLSMETFFIRLHVTQPGFLAHTAAEGADGW